MYYRKYKNAQNNTQNIKNTKYKIHTYTQKIKNTKYKIQKYEEVTKFQMNIKHKEIQNTQRTTKLQQIQRI